MDFASKTIIVCDASQAALGVVLAHIMPDSTEKPIPRLRRNELHFYMV